jgi:hypothetical protein
MAGDNETGTGTVLTVMGAAEQLLAADKPEEGATGAEEKPQVDATEEEQAGATEEQEAESKDEAKDEGEGEGEKEPRDGPTEVEAPDTAFVTVQNEDGTTRRVTVAELKKSPLLLADYTRKTQKAAEVRKQAEAEAGEMKRAREQYLERIQRADEALTEMTPKEPDWDKIKAERPDEYPTLRADWSRFKEMRENVKAEKARVEMELRREQEVVFAGRVAEEGKLLVAAVPELGDKERAPARKAAMYAFAESIGFSRQEVDTEVDHRLLVMLDRATRFEELQQEKVKLAAQPRKLELVAGSKDVKTLAPGAAKRVSPAGDKQRSELIKHARATGRVADAAAVIAALDNT